MGDNFLKLLKEIQESLDQLHLENQCRICKKICTHLEKHHIIAQDRRDVVPHLVDLPGNIVFICNDCHSQTTSYLLKNRSKKSNEYWTQVKKLSLRKKAL